MGEGEDAFTELVCVCESVCVCNGEETDEGEGEVKILAIWRFSDKETPVCRTSESKTQKSKVSRLCQPNQRLLNSKQGSPDFPLLPPVESSR